MTGTDDVYQFVPTINGYKRLVVGEAFWAPNAVTYGYDSRAASIRIISPPSCPPEATRFEVRVPGADMNPYFTLSAIFGLGLRGIEKKLPLSIEPISHFTPEDRKSGKASIFQATLVPAKDGFVTHIPFSQVKMLAASLEAATEQMTRQGSIAREVFGNDFVEHFGGTREHEVRVWNEVVTSWEGTSSSTLPDS